MQILFMSLLFFSIGFKIENSNIFWKTNLQLLLAGAVAQKPDDRSDFSCVHGLVMVVVENLEGVQNPLLSLCCDSLGDGGAAPTPSAPNSTRTSDSFRTGIFSTSEGGYKY